MLATYYFRIEFKIRNAGLADAAVIAQFNIDLARESENLALDPATVKAGVEALLRDESKGTYFVAESKGEVVGQLLITHEWSDWRNGDFWWLQSVFVRADARRRGIFQALLEHATICAKQRGDVTGIRLYVEKHNDGAIKTYHRLGFEHTHYDVLEKLL
jgi:GNAT superfamily N-acetyltransferase